jgi:hypothetical protein
MTVLEVKAHASNQLPKFAVLNMLVQKDSSIAEGIIFNLGLRNRACDHGLAMTKELESGMSNDVVNSGCFRFRDE